MPETRPPAASFSRVRPVLPWLVVLPLLGGLLTPYAAATGGLIAIIGWVNAAIVYRLLRSADDLARPDDLRTLRVWLYAFISLPLYTVVWAGAGSLVAPLLQAGFVQMLRGGATLGKSVGLLLTPLLVLVLLYIYAVLYRHLLSVQLLKRPDL